MPKKRQSSRLPFNEWKQKLVDEGKWEERPRAKGEASTRKSADGKSSTDKQRSTLPSREAVVQCPHCGGMHVARSIR